MKRIELPELFEMKEEDLCQHQRFPSNLVRALTHTSSSCVASYLDLGFALRMNKLSARNYELIILRVAALSESSYEKMQHLPAARQAGWTETDIHGIQTGQWDTFDDASQTLLVFVDECVREVKVSDKVFTQALLYFSQQQIAHITLLIGFYMMTARYLETLEVELDKTPCSVLMRN